ncbi:MAG TPA: Asp23/Gls24 family envelope stress response protein [Chloroflexia bacterium]|nr:Asp23/Gls24 family envelope stress response protein [Chloroflexia bacterium]
MISRHRKDPQALDLGLDGSTAGIASGDGAPAQQSTDTVSQQTTLGKIEVSPRTIAHIASRATQEAYGVVGLTSRHSRPGWAELLRREDEHKGVEVKFSGGRVIIDLYVVIEYGTRISEVARNIMSSVKFAVESALGVPVVQVNVNVQNIRVSS